MKTDQEQQFENWFKQQPFYSQQVFSHGERLFIKDGDDYKFAAVRTAYAAWSYRAFKMAGDE